MLLTLGNERSARSGPAPQASHQRPHPPDRGDRRLRDVHAEPRLHRHRHRASHHGEGVRRRSGAHERRAHLLSAVAGGVHSRERLDRRPLRRANGVPRRDRGVHPGLDPVRPRRQPGVPGRRAHPARHGRRDDGAGRPARAAADRGEDRTGGGDGVAHRAGAAGAGARAAGRRLHRHLFLLALDLRHQRADRHSRHRAGQPVLRGRARAAARPVRRHRTAAVRDRALRPDVRPGDRRPRRRAAARPPRR